MARTVRTLPSCRWITQGLCLLAVLCCTALSACGASSTNRSGVLRISVLGRLTSLDPATAGDPSSLFAATLLNSGLVKFGPDLHIIPELAVSIPTISADGRSYTFTVRDGARFADGSMCTAADVATSLARALSPRLHSAPARRYLGNIVGARAVESGRRTRLAGVRVIDPLTVRIRLTRPDADFLNKLALPVASVVEQHGNTLEGTGPWAIAGWEPKGILSLVPRLHFYGGHLQLRGLKLIPVSNRAQAVAMYRKGTLDVAPVPVDQWHTLSSRSDLQQSSGLGAYYALPESPTVGIALATALNRDSLVAAAGLGLTALQAIVPSAVPDYQASLPALDPQQAPAAPMSIDLQVRNRDDTGARALAKALRNQWPASSTGSLVQIVHAAFPIPDPAMWLRAASTNIHSAWFRAIVLRAGELTNDPVTRMNAYGRVENWAIAQGFVIPLAQESLGYLIRPSLEGLLVTPFGIMPDNNSWSLVSFR